MKTNMGFTDRALRILAAFAIGGLYFAGVISGTLAIILVVVGGIFIVTGFIGFCPLYLPFGISTRSKSAETNRQNISALIQQGAQVIDVRTRNEFNTGHFAGSINIPLNAIRNRLGEIDKAKPVVVCCASGMRSRSATEILKSNGFQVVNGGAWSSLER